MKINIDIAVFENSIDVTVHATDNLYIRLTRYITGVKPILGKLNISTCLCPRNADEICVAQTVLQKASSAAYLMERSDNINQIKEDVEYNFFQNETIV